MCKNSQSRRRCFTQKPKRTSKKLVRNTYNRNHVKRRKKVNVAKRKLKATSGR